MYKTAIDYAKERNFTEIVELLAKGPIRTEKTQSEQEKKVGKAQIQAAAPTNEETPDEIQAAANEVASDEIQAADECRDIGRNYAPESSHQHPEKCHFYRTPPTFQGVSGSADSFFIDEYTEGKFIHNVGKIGEGATSIAYKCIDTRTNQPLCKKVLKYNNEQANFKDAQNAMKEFQVLHDIDHPCICKSFYINTAEPIEIINKGEKETVTTISLFLEFVEYSLSDILNSQINDTFKAKIVVEIAHAMKYLHARGMIHRDLKIENIMVNSAYQTKLVDFGLVRINECALNGYSFVEESLTKGIGTFAYMSPEMLNEEDYDSKTDVYSFGIVLHFMYFGNIPKQSMRDKTNGKPIKVPSSPSPSVSQFCIDLITRCLSPNPSDRPSFEEILNGMRSNRFELSSGVNPEIISQRDMQLEAIEKME